MSNDNNIIVISALQTTMKRKLSLNAKMTAVYHFLKIFFKKYINENDLYLYQDKLIMVLTYQLHFL